MTTDLNKISYGATHVSCQGDLHYKFYQNWCALKVVFEVTRPYTRHKMRPHPALRHFQRFLQKRYGPTDGRTDRRTDTPSYRDARTHLKTRFLISVVYTHARYCLISLTHLFLPNIKIHPASSTMILLKQK